MVLTFEYFIVSYLHIFAAVPVVHMYQVVVPVLQLRLEGTSNRTIEQVYVYVMKNYRANN